MTETGSLEFSSVSAASSIRQRVRYSMGDSPTVCLNFKAKVDRDMPARFPSSCNVQQCAGSSCIELIAALELAQRRLQANDRLARSCSSAKVDHSGFRVVRAISSSDR